MNSRIHRAAVLLATVVVAGTAAWFAGRLGIEQDNQSMQSAAARNDAVYQTFQREFDSEYELMVVVSRSDLNTGEGMRRLQEEADWLRGLDGVREVYLPPSAAAGHGLVSSDGLTIGLLVVLQSDQPRRDRSSLLEIVENEAPERFEGTVDAVGLPLLKAAVATRIARDQRVVTPLSGVAMMVMLALLFRRMAGVILPMLIVVLSLLTTLGLYAACGLELNSITSLLPPVVIVLSVSVAVHLLDAWIHAVDSGERGETAIRSAIRSVWKPCVFTAAMTAAGLLSLVLSPIPAVKLFGSFAAIGVCLSVLYAFTLLPIALRWTPERPDRGGNDWMKGLLQRTADLPVRHPLTILLTAAVVTVVAASAATRIRNNTDLIYFFKPHDPVFIAHDRVSRSLGSVRSLDLLVQRTDGAPFELIRDLSDLQALTKEIERIPGVVGTSSIVDLAAGQPLPAGVPHPMLRRFVGEEGRLLRMEVLLGDIGSARASEICDRIAGIAAVTPGPAWQVAPTGAYYEVVRDSNKLVSTLVRSFAITFAIVLLSTCLLFRSPAVLIPAFIPNILPIIWGAGLMGVLGIDLSTATTMVAAVVIGLAVDDTIHYLHHFQTYRHLPVSEATRSTTRRIGRALVVSSIVLVGGFWMGALGSFIPTNTFALMTGAMMASALLCDLLVLPAYLNLIHAKPHPARKPL